ncbi:3-oxo-behenoyl-CoA reductase [Aureococcus anophagefferens]|nr:3-oxo-behenoyl-CoA reductase [Aureococcus anophagefferens]
MAVPTFLLYILAAPTALWLAAYFLPLLYIRLRGVQDLKKKYGATGLNVVVAALPDKFLEPAVAELSAAYKGQEFVAVGVSFAPGADYLEKIKAATADKDVQIVFNNAGFIAFMSQFAASIAVELQCKGIDVCVIHPSPVASNFYNKVEHKIDSMESFKKLAVDRSELPREIFASIGRCVLRDVGNTAVGMRLGVALLPYSALAHIIALVAPFLPDYVENDKKRGQV